MAFPSTEAGIREALPLRKWMSLGAVCICLFYDCHLFVFVFLFLLSGCCCFFWGGLLFLGKSREIEMGVGRKMSHGRRQEDKFTPSPTACLECRLPTAKNRLLGALHATGNFPFLAL